MDNTTGSQCSLLGPRTSFSATLQGSDFKPLDRSNPSDLSIGWLTFWGWQTAIASSAFLSGILVQGILKLTTPTYELKSRLSVLLLWAAIFFAILVNIVIGGLLPKFEGFVLILHILGFFAILLPLIVYGTHQPASEVFGNFMNTGNWPTQGLSCMIGLVGNVFAFGGTYATQANRVYLTIVQVRTVPFMYDSHYSQRILRPG